MLLNKLYTISSFGLSGSGDKITAQIMLNKDHPLFQGHFPGNPILPGVCSVQIVLEILEKALGKEVMLTRAGNIKYLGFINPVKSAELKFELDIKDMETGAVSCNATILAGQTKVCSFKGEYANVKTCSC
jgi:3-hydroxyacyl-[acyl-carrier-protein] dehydratase